jgi:hypothetical protein
MSRAPTPSPAATRTAVCSRRSCWPLVRTLAGLSACGHRRGLFLHPGRAGREALPRPVRRSIRSLSSTSPTIQSSFGPHASSAGIERRSEVGNGRNRESHNQHFYEKMGFVKVRETEIDLDLVWSGLEHERNCTQTR